MAEKTYLEVFREHYPNVVLKDFYGYCPAGFFKYGMDMHHPDCTAECDKCWLCTADSEWCENGEYDVPEVWKAMDVQDKPSEPPATVQPERAEEISGAFNYAVLTAELGDYLRRKEEQLKNEYMNFTANCGRIFAEAQEKLAKHGFGENNGVFEKWITSMGFKKSTVYEMIKIHQFRSSEIRTNEQAQLFDSLSKSLQYEVAKPSAPPELVEQVMNGDITTHKDYIAMKKELEEANKKIELAEFHSKQQSESFKRVADASKTNYEKYQEERHKNDDLEKRIRELENRPVDVAIQSDEDALAEKDQEISELKDEVERLSNKNVKVFAVRLTLDEYEKLVQIVCGGCRGGNDPVILEAVKKAQIIRL